jgi:type 1 fimbria pilin
MPRTVYIKRIYVLKKSLLTLSLGLAASLVGTSVFANTGTVRFEGKITASTCPIVIINPGDGSSGEPVKMGEIAASRFTAAGQELGGSPFDLRVEGGAGCGITPTSKAKVTFNGTPDPTGSYFAVTPTSDGAKGVVIVLKDKNGTPVAPGSASAEYDLNDTGFTDLRFNPYYRSTAATVTTGPASADVQFVVDIN